MFYRFGVPSFVLFVPAVLAATGCFHYTTPGALGAAGSGLARDATEVSVGGTASVSEVAFAEGDLTVAVPVADDVHLDAGSHYGASMVGGNGGGWVGARWTPPAEGSVRYGVGGGLAGGLSAGVPFGGVYTQAGLAGTGRTVRPFGDVMVQVLQDTEGSNPVWSTADVGLEMGSEQVALRTWVGATVFSGTITSTTQCLGGDCLGGGDRFAVVPAPAAGLSVRWSPEAAAN